MSTQSFSETDVRRDPLGRFAQQIGSGLADELVEHGSTECAPAVRRAIDDAGAEAWSEDDLARLEAAEDTDLDAHLRGSLDKTQPGRPRHLLLQNYLRTLPTIPGRDAQADARAEAEHFVAFHAAVDYLRQQGEAGGRCHVCAAPMFDPHADGCVQDGLPALATGESLTVESGDVGVDLHGFDRVIVTGREDGRLDVRSEMQASVEGWADVLTETTGYTVSDATAREVIGGQLECAVQGDMVVFEASPADPSDDVDEVAQEGSEGLTDVREFDPAVVRQMTERAFTTLEEISRAAHEDRLEREHAEGLR